MDSLITSTSIALGEAYMDGAILGVIILINVLLLDVEKYAVQRIFCRWHRKREYHTLLPNVRGVSYPKISNN